MEMGIAVLFGVFIVANTYSVYNKLYSYHDKTESIQKLNSVEFNIPVHLAQKAYKNKNLVLDGYYNDSIKMAGKNHNNMDVPVQLFHRNYSDYQSNLTNKILTDSIRNNQEDLDIKKNKLSNKMRLDPKDITNFVDTQGFNRRYKYEFPIEMGINRINIILGKLFGNNKSPTPPYNF